MNSRPVSGCSSETRTHPIDMNNNNNNNNSLTLSLLALFWVSPWAHPPVGPKNTVLLLIAPTAALFPCTPYCKGHLLLISQLWQPITPCVVPLDLHKLSAFQHPDFTAEGGDSMFLRNVSIHIQLHSSSQPKNQRRHLQSSDNFKCHNHSIMNRLLFSLSQ
jgi:hypothetical protein